MGRGPAIDPYAGCFEAQLKVLRDPARFKSIKAGRRAGKTTLAIDDLIYGLENDPPGSESIYGALTIGSAKRIMWEPTKQEIRRFGIGWYKLNHNDHTIVNTQNDNILRVYGSETLRELEKPRGGGKNLRRIRWDECGAQRPTYLKYLFQDVLQPMMMDNLESDAWMMGSPGPAPIGFWYDITEGDAVGFSRHAWTAKENPHVDFDAFVQLLFATNGWDWDTPTFRREFLGLWGADPSRMVFRYHPSRNVLPQLPELAAGDEWVRALILDFGVGDATACVALAWPKRFGRGVYAIHAWQKHGLAPSDAATLVHQEYQRFRPEFILGDTGGMGKAYWAEWNKRFPGIEMRAADKKDKRAGLEFLSDALHIADASGPIHQHRGFFVLEHLRDLQTQLATLHFDEDREDIQEGQQDDQAVCCVYGYKVTPAFLNATTEPEPPPVYGQGNTWHLRPPPKQPAPLAQAFSGAFRKGRR